MIDKFSGWLILKKMLRVLLKIADIHKNIIKNIDEFMKIF